MDLEKALYDHFGYTGFRSHQKQIIESILEDRNVLAVLPTGGGKSLCYQLPALISDGFSLVISPLISLMKDQTDNINRHGRVAAYINSTLNFRQSEEVLREISDGSVKLLYLAPEKLESREFLAKMKFLQPRFLFIDEAHCISQWGHNFRPSYMGIRKFAEENGITRISAFTATATPEVVDDIILRLGLRDTRKFIKGFQRDNLSLQVMSDSDKKLMLTDLISGCTTPAIVYTSSRKSAEEVSAYLEQQGLQSSFYHAGMQTELRRLIQEQFTEGKIKTVCATNAFGMGIDKKDISLVVHYNMPGSIENYYQEIGRAGRDGKPAQAVLLYDKNDRAIHEYFISGSYPGESAIRAVYNALCDYGKVALGSYLNSDIRVDYKYISNYCRKQVSRPLILSAIAALERNGYMRLVSETEKKYYIQLNIGASRVSRHIEQMENSSVKDILLLLIRKHGSRITEQKQLISISRLAEECGITESYLTETFEWLHNTGIIDFESPVKYDCVRMLSARVSDRYLILDTSEIEKQKEMATAKLSQMEEFVSTPVCRMKFILDYFGEETENYKCGKCDICSPAVSEKKSSQNSEASAAALTRTPVEKQDYEAGLRLFNQLRICRNESAVKFQQAPFFICPDEILRKIIESKPASVSALLAIPGFTSRMFNKVGHDFLEIIKEHLSAQKLHEQTISEQEPASFESTGTQPVVYEEKEKMSGTLEDVYRLVEKGHRLNEIAAITKQPEHVLALQIESILEYDPQLEIDNLFRKGAADEMLQEIINGYKDMKELKDRLHGKYSFAELRIAAAKAKAGAGSAK